MHDLHAPLPNELLKKEKKWIWIKKMSGSFPKNKRSADIRAISYTF